MVPANRLKPNFAEGVKIGFGGCRFIGEGAVRGTNFELSLSYASTVVQSKLLLAIYVLKAKLQFSV